MGLSRQLAVFEIIKYILFVWNGYATHLSDKSTCKCRPLVKRRKSNIKPGPGKGGKWRNASENGGKERDASFRHSAFQGLF